VAAVVTIVLLCLAVGVLYALLLRTLRQSHSRDQELMGRVLAEQRRAESSAADVARLEQQVRDLVDGRLPQPLQPLTTDSLIELDQAPLRSILFTQVGTSADPGYEYTLRCRNDGPERYYPRVRILLFNEVGVQTGSADLRDSADVTPLGVAGMAPGESGSFSGRVTREFDDVPKYFIILTLPADGRLPRLFR